MATTTLRPNQHHGGLLELMALVIALAILAALALPPVKWSAHAGAHAEASRIQQCLDPSNLMQIWVNSSGERLNCLVRLPDGKVGDAVLQWSCRQATWLGVTAYVIGDGELVTAVNVLKAKACSLVWP